MAITAIELTNLSKQSGMFRMHNLSAGIPRGRMTSIIGPNGSGKSTLLRLITGLLAPDSGEIIVDGKPYNHYSRAEFARTAAMLPQSKDFVPELTVRELVGYGRSPHKRSFMQRRSAEDREVADWAMEAMNIQAYGDRMFHSLSGGEQQKARIAMALAQKTDILLLDEPTTYLDITHQLELMETLTRINRKYRMTIIMVLHDLQQAAAFSHHMIAMKKGRLVADGSPRELLTPLFLKEVYAIDAQVQYDTSYPLIIPKLSIHAEYGDDDN